MCPTSCGARRGRPVSSARRWPLADEAGLVAWQRASLDAPWRRLEATVGRRHRGVGHQTTPLRWVAVAALTVTGCGGHDAGLRWTGTVTDSAGIQLVHNPAEGVWSPGEEWSFEEEVRIGRVEGAPELQFGRIIDLDVDPLGNIYVLDGQAQEVRVFSADGEHLRSLGAPGEGPGELSPRTQAVIVGADRVVRIVDAGNRRVTSFGPSGDHIGQVRREGGGGGAIRWDADGSGRLVAQLRYVGGVSVEAGPGGDPLVTYGAEGAPGDTLHLLPREAGNTIFGPHPLWDLSPRVLVTAVMTAYRLEIRSLDGQLVRVITRDVEREPVTESDRRFLRRQAREQLVEVMGVGPQSADRLISSWGFADFYPAFASIVVGPFGSVMVQRVRTVADLAEADGDVEPNSMGIVGAPEWDVFDDRGRYLGPVTLPTRFQLVKVVDDLIYGIWRNDLDVEFVVRLRVDVAGP